ncbi:hypothetical protein CJD36_004020 [Flavipsychrobacter stenotrophus]|uniref:Uncharacterized protein n=1 Tax=Flavipsychrobacter stenotrophus TaxID=2077091 RepID=A0A2S7T148_9BACT|nr:hypothetical protein [Flavipsychrobacter stenotrophus]PQJ12922.1 hypothetical protein CJD36_004020 [Flavipsychrobacter stenotrophus]
MEFSELSAYEKEIINKILPLFHSDGTSMPLHICIVNIIYSDNVSLLDNNKLSHRAVGEIVANVTQNVIDFLKENHFISKRADGSYTKEEKGEDLAKAGSIEDYLG